MLNVIQFPSHSAREWKAFKKEIDSMLLDAGMNAKHRDGFIKHFEPIFHSFMFSFSKKVELTNDIYNLAPVRSLIANFDEAGQRFSEFIDGLINERLNHEIKLYCDRLAVQ
jgi:hypothetical protein